MSEYQKKRLKLTDQEIEQRKVMLEEEEAKKETCDRQIKNYEDPGFLKMQKLQTELQLLQMKQQAKSIPQLEEDFKNEKYKENIKNSINSVKQQLKNAEQNIKTLRYNINTGFAYDPNK